MDIKTIYQRIFLITATVAVVALAAICLAGCSSTASTTSTASSTSSATSASAGEASATSNNAAAQEPIWRIVASRVRDTDRESGYKYENGNLIASLEYNSVSEFAYKDNGLTRDERTDGNSGIATTYTEKATCDELGRIVTIERIWQGATRWKRTYTYFDNTMNLKTETEESGPYTTITEYNEQGYVVVIKKTDGNTNKSEEATFTYEEIDDKTLGFEYKDYEGKAAKYYILFDEDGNVGSITDGTTYVDFLYEKVNNPSAWLFTETGSSTPMLGYTTRKLFDTEA